MPVVFKCTGTLFPNKPHQGGGVGSEATEYKLPLDAVAHRYKRPDGDYVQLLKPKVDHITVLLQVADDDVRKGIVSALVNMKKDFEYHEVAEPAHLPTAPKYKVSASIKHPPTDSVALLQAQPNTKSTKHFLRLQMNPSALKATGMTFIRGVLADLMNDDGAYAAWLSDGLVTRVDVACDMVNAQIGDLLLRSVDGGKTHGYYSDVGDLQTIYLGMKGTDKASKFYVYDKATQQMDKDHAFTFGGIQHTRVEFRATKQLQFEDLKSMSCPLGQLEVYDCFAVKPPEDEYHWRHFMDSCRHRGIENALALIPEPKRSKYETALTQALHNAWPSEKLWSHWGDVIDTIGLLSPH